MHQLAQNYLFYYNRGKMHLSCFYYLLTHLYYRRFVHDINIDLGEPNVELHSGFLAQI